LTYYLDTSALAKRYLPEPGSSSVRALFQRRRRIAVSRIAYAELCAAVARAARAEAISHADRDRVLAALDADFTALDIVEVRAALVRSVRGLVVRSPLRGYDAVQLASALDLHRRGVAVDLWSADATLIEAARAEGLRATLVG
jgi:predicted nucleic acid-binding protein